MSQSIKMAESMVESTDIVILEPGKVRFEKSGTGVMGMVREDGTVYPRVYPICSFPVSDHDRFISIRNVENKEIGMIKDIKDFPVDQQVIIRNELRLRYFVPIIREIQKIEEEFGMYCWETRTDRGKKTFYVKGRNENIVFRNKTKLLITDIEECRYEISDCTKLPRHSQLELDKVL